MSDPDRPRIALECDSIDVVLQAAAALALLLSGILVVTAWPRLPDSVPVHFGANGTPDAWGSKRGLLLLPGLGLAIVVVLTLFERVPHIHNYPWPITPENARRQYLNSRRMLTTLKAVVAWVLAIGFWRSCAVAEGQAAGLGGWFLPVSLLAIFGTVAFFLVQGARTR